MTARDLMLARLAATPRMLRELIADVASDAGSRAPAPGEWSIVEVVRHLVEGDRDTFLPRLRRMLTEMRPTFDKRAPVLGDATDLPTLAAAFASAREQALKRLLGLDEAGWQREGVSPSRGALSVEAYASTVGTRVPQVVDLRYPNGFALRVKG